VSQHIPQWRWHLLLGAFLLATFFFLVFPGTSFAHAELLRSDPKEDALLRVAPTQVRMWFSEALDRSSTLSTAVVVDAANHRVDTGDARVVGSSGGELDVTLRDHLPPGMYTVAWSVASEDDGHLTSGTFRFTVTRPDGSLPPQGTTPNGQTVTSNLGTGSSESAFLLSFLTITLLELTAVFWVGAHLFQHFVLQSLAEEQKVQGLMTRQIQRRFERRLAVPTVLLLLLANSGILLGQVVAIANGNGAHVLDPSLLMTLLTSGHFGLFWLARELLIVLVLRLEDVAINDSYFIDHKLYPNVDFYSGIIYKALGIPTQMFTVLFALGRLPGWIAHWKEMIEDPGTKIARPRQIYTGDRTREYVGLDQRK